MLATKLKNNKKDDLEKKKAIIKKYLEDEIVGRYYFQKGRIEFSLKSDEDVMAAEKVFAENGKYSSILSTIEKPVKPFNVKKKF